MTKLEHELLKASKKKPEKSMSFFVHKKPPIVHPAAKSTSLVATWAAAIPSVTEPPAHAVRENAAVSQSPPAEASAGPVTSYSGKRSCEGIFPEYQQKEFQVQINTYVLHATINATSLYKPNSVGSTGLTNLFMKTCTGIGTLQKTKIRNIHSCNECHNGFYVSICIVHIICWFNQILSFFFFLPA